jgi:dynein heavy chain
MYLKTHVNDFKETMPIVRALGNRNLKEEHWLEIKTLLNMLDFPLEERNFTLGELMGFKVSAMQEEIENISVTATQESKLSKQILDITETWNKTEFDIEKYREKDYILSGIDKVVVILDESLSEISDI